MITHAGDFIAIDAGKVKSDQLEKQLLAAQYTGDLYEELATNDNAYERLKGLEPGLLHDLENVLLRHDDPKKWRDYLKATLKRKGEEKLGKCFKQLLEWIEPLLSTETQIPGDHPVTQAMGDVRNNLRRIMEKQSLNDEELKQWQDYLHELEQSIFIAATREWLCLSLRRVIYEPVKQRGN